MYHARPFAPHQIEAGAEQLMKLVNIYIHEVLIGDLSFFGCIRAVNASMR